MLRSGTNLPEVLCCPGPFYDGADASDVCLSVQHVSFLRCFLPSVAPTVALPTSDSHLSL